MRFLLDTHLLLWAALRPGALPPKAAILMDGDGNDLIFSVVSLWEVVVKLGRNREDFQINPKDFRENLLDNGYRELNVFASHVLAVGDLPPIHGDPFDRLLIAQARVEGATFLTADAVVARYHGDIQKV